MLINKSQAILKRFIDLKFSVWFTLGSEDETMFCDTELFSGWPPVKIFKTRNDQQSTLLAESLRSFLDKSGKCRKEERGKRTGEKGKRKEEKGKRKEERGKRKEEKFTTKYRTAGHLGFWKPWPVTGHTATAFFFPRNYIKIRAVLLSSHGPKATPVFLNTCHLTIDNYINKCEAGRQRDGMNSWKLAITPTFLPLMGRKTDYNTSVLANLKL